MRYRFRSFAVTALQIYTLLYPLVGFQIVGSSYFQSSGQPLKAAILEMTRQVIFLIPLYLLLPPVLTSVFGLTGLQGVVVSAPVSDGLATLMTTVFVVREVRKLRGLREASRVAVRPAVAAGELGDAAAQQA